MSQPGDNGGQPEREAFRALESAVGQALARISQMTQRLEDAEARSSELGELVKRFTGDEAEAGRILTRIRGIEEETTDLKARLDQGRTGVDRILAKIRFLENQQ